MGLRFAEFDWTAHPLGSPQSWQPEVRSAVAVVLTSRFPIVLWLGAEDLFLIYNDAYISILGDRHPEALGQRGRYAWWDIWQPISPRGYLERLRNRKTLLVYARYDLTFPVDLSEDLVREFRERAIPHEVAVLGCGHYSSGRVPFKFVDGWILTRFLKRALLGHEALPQTAE